MLAKMEAYHNTIKKVADDFPDDSDSDSDSDADSDSEWDDDIFADGISSHRAIKSLKHVEPSPSRRFNAAESVFGITELAEMIIMDYIAATTADAIEHDKPRMEPFQSTSAIRRVSNAFNWTINGSFKLKARSRVHGLGREKAYLNTHYLLYNHAPLLWLFSQLLPCWNRVRAFEVRVNNDFCIFLDGVNSFPPPEQTSPDFAQASVRLAQKKLLPFCKSGKDGRESWRQFPALQYGGRIVLETPRIFVQRSHALPEGTESAATVSWQQSYRDKDIRFNETATLGDVFDAYSGWLFSVPVRAVVAHRWSWGPSYYPIAHNN